MKLRCIHCGRQSDLTDTFECVDTASCDAAVAILKTPPRKVCIYVDCACIYGEQTQLGIGVYTTIDGVHSPEYSGTKHIGVGTVPLGEWTAMQYGYAVAEIMSNSLGRVTIQMFGDAKNVVNGINGMCGVASKFKRYRHSIGTYQAKLGIKFLGVTWIPREQNKEADKLSKQALLITPQLHSVHIDRTHQYTQNKYDAALGTKNTFMSNLWQLRIPIVDADGNKYWNSEGWYMAQRTSDSAVRAAIAKASKLGGYESRQARSRYTLDQNEDNRVYYMINAVTAKFDANPNLQKLLLEIDEEIIEKNYWHDTLFGVDDKTLQGANMLGRILMNYRDTHKH